MEIYYSLRSYWGTSGLIFFFVMISMPGCGPVGSEKYENPIYFDAALAKVDSLWHSSIEDYQNALEASYQAFEDPGVIDLYRKYDRLHRLYYERAFDPYLADVYADSMLLMLEAPAVQRLFPAYYARALLSKGDVLRDQNKYSEAYAFFYRGREILHQSGNKCLYHLYASKLATTYFKQEKYREAIPYYVEAIEYLDDCDSTDFFNFYLQQGLLDNIALTYGHLGEMDQALMYFDSTLNFIEDRGTKFMHSARYKQLIDEAIAVVEGNTGSSLLVKGDTLFAEALFKRSIETNLKSRNNLIDAQLTMAKLAFLYLETDRLPELKALLEEMAVAMELRSNDLVQLNWHQLNWLYYDKKNVLDSSYMAMKRYSYLKDSLTEAANKPAVLDVDLEFERMGREHQLELLKKDNELKTAYLMVLFFLFASVILVTWLIWQHWRKSRHHVSELKRLNGEILGQHENIKKNLLALEQSQQHNSRMMKIVAHDLRNPVGAIHSLSNMLLDDVDIEENPEEVEEMVGLINVSSSTAMGLISDLLVLDTSLTNMDKELVEVDVTLKYCVDLLQVKAMEKHQNIVLDVEPAKVLASREKLWRVFSNLINNAIKFSPDDATIEVGLKREEDVVRVFVKDRGIGIPPELRGKIFSLASEIKRKGTRGEESFGFGLSISKQIVEAHDGRIWFETETDKGTTFIVEMKAST